MSVRPWVLANVADPSFDGPFDFEQGLTYNLGKVAVLAMRKKLPGLLREQ